MQLFDRIQEVGLQVGDLAKTVSELHQFTVQLQRKLDAATATNAALTKAQADQNEKVTTLTLLICRLH